MLRIDDYISPGCFGVVFRATETSSGRYFAVKIVPKNPHWRQEATFHHSLSAHRNIVTLHAVVEIKEFGCLIFGTAMARTSVALSTGLARSLGTQTPSNASSCR